MYSVNNNGRKHFLNIDLFWWHLYQYIRNGFNVKKKQEDERKAEFHKTSPGGVLAPSDVIRRVIRSDYNIFCSALLRFSCSNRKPLPLRYEVYVEFVLDLSVENVVKS